MRSICKKGSVTLVVVLALCVVASASASASSWYVGGTELGSSASLATSPVMMQSITLSSPALGVTIECSSVELKSADIASHTGGSIEHLVLKGCKYEGANCGLGSSTIESKPLTVEAALGKNSPEDTLLLKPASKTVLAEYEITGNKCAIAGPVQLTGKAQVILPKGGEELSEQELSFHAEEAAGELKWGSTPMQLTGEAKVKLASASAWSFH